MSKGELIFFFVGVIIIVGPLLFCYWSYTIYDGDCLREIAEDFCELKGYERKVRLNGSTFHCTGDIDVRTNPKGKEHMFYFLEQELNKCIVKDAETWGKR